MFTESQIIAQAIDNLAVIEFGYDGYRRVFWPYVLGTTKKGETEVFGWQQLSGKGGAPDFRRFRVDGMTGLVVTGSHFARPFPPVDLAKLNFARVIASA